tara:strand:- start:176 stop:1096 length:921 start_codon:yes stop_codon:yes gene_type:complete
MGTSLESVYVLSNLIQLDIQISAIFTRPAKPFGRGREIQNPPIKEYADNNSIDIYQYASLINNELAYKELKNLSPDLIIVADFGLIIPDKILKLPRLGCLNIHPSLLPKYRGPSPVSTAILNENKFTGVTVMLMDEGLDTGPIIAQKKVEFLYQENAKDLTKRLFEIGALLISDILSLWEFGKINPTLQDESKATYTKKLSKEDGRIDWNDSAININKKILAYNPWPGVFTIWNNRRVKVIEAKLGNKKSINSFSKGVVSQIYDDLHVMTGEGSLILIKIQLEGKKIMHVKDFVAGYKNFINAKLL